METKVPVEDESCALMGKKPVLENDQHSPCFKKKVFKAVTQRDPKQLEDLLKYLEDHQEKLSGPEFRDENGKTILMKALFNLKGGENKTIPVVIDIAEKTGDLQELVNADSKSCCFEGQTALHVAIERRSLEYVKLLVKNGADVQAKACGCFFKSKSKNSFYFGELPLSLAACTNQPKIVDFLLDNNANARDKDSNGNTVLHTLVISADNNKKDNESKITNNLNQDLAEMYDRILIHDYKVQKNREFEKMENNGDLNPLQLAAKLGKTEMLRHILNREFMEEETKFLSRKFTEWVNGPVRSSLYDMSSVTTDEDNSVMEIIIMKSKNENRPKMLQIEPLHSFLQRKWHTFAYKVFLQKFVTYLFNLLIFSAVAYCRKKGQPPFPVERKPADIFLCIGQIICICGAIHFLHKSFQLVRWRKLNKWTLFRDGFFEILLFLHGLLILVSVLLYFCGLRQYVGVLSVSLAIGWVHMLYFARGFKRLGVCIVMMQKMILGDLLRFLFIYFFMFFGFSAAIVSLIENPVANNQTTYDTQVGPEMSSFIQPVEELESGFHDISFTMLELFKFTIGMGDLQFTKHVENTAAFYFLLISYIVLTFILMLNMLIALMGNTVSNIAEKSESIWHLQRAFAIMEMEKFALRCQRGRMNRHLLENIPIGDSENELPVFRVTEKNWEKWRSNLCSKLNEDPPVCSKQTNKRTSVEPTASKDNPKRKKSFTGSFLKRPSQANSVIEEPQLTH